jgi:FkbM family methyltransferase
LRRSGILLLNPLRSVIPFGRKFPRRFNTVIFWFQALAPKLGITTAFITVLKFLIKRNGLVKVSMTDIKTSIFLRPRTSDILAFIQIFIEDDYELPIDIRPKFILDGGANAGYASIFFANKYPNAQVIAVEPNASNFKLLKKNISKYPNIKAIQAAIWHKRTFVNLENQTGHKWSFRVKETDSEKGEVETLIIEDFVNMSEDNFIDIFKLDIEGAEKQVFSFSENWLDKVKLIIVELHENYEPGVTEIFFSAVNKFAYKDYSKGENVILMRV